MHASKEGKPMIYELAIHDVDTVDVGHTLPDPIDGEPDRFEYRWVQTDGWRGHYDVTATDDIWTHLEDGWVTGDWDDAGEHAESRVLARIQELERIYGSVLVIVSPTSNVFATGYDVFTLTTRLDRNDSGLVPAESDH